MSTKHSREIYFISNCKSSTICIWKDMNSEEQSEDCGWSGISNFSLMGIVSFYVKHGS